MTTVVDAGAASRKITRLQYSQSWDYLTSGLGVIRTPVAFGNTLAAEDGNAAEGKVGGGYCWTWVVQAVAARGGYEYLYFWSQIIHQHPCSPYAERQQTDSRGRPQSATSTSKSRRHKEWTIGYLVWEWKAPLLTRHRRLWGSRPTDWEGTVQEILGRGSAVGNNGKHTPCTSPSPMRACAGLSVDGDRTWVVNRLNNENTAEEGCIDASHPIASRSRIQTYGKQAFVLIRGA
ncbi:hypothetical protein C8R45DRAFT_941357 [Mycena sanguinolenta]|nr:hypothetical protein C8R45DRAFT_941357 [Mycena sanguinolenta]